MTNVATAAPMSDAGVRTAFTLLWAGLCRRHRLAGHRGNHLLSQPCQGHQRQSVGHEPHGGGRRRLSDDVRRPATGRHARWRGCDRRAGRCAAAGPRPGVRMAAVAVTAHVTGLCATIWWRRAAARLGRPGTLLLVLAVPVAFVGFYAWAWGQVSPIMATMSSNEALAELLLPGLLVSFVMVCAVLRAAMLAFDFIAPDLRVTLATAPRRAARKCLFKSPPTRVQPAGGLRSVGLASYAASSGRIGLGPVLALGLACCALVGAVTVGLELLLIHVTRDALAARSGAAAGVLLSVCLVMLWLSRPSVRWLVGQLQQLGRGCSVTMPSYVGQLEGYGDPARRLGICRSSDRTRTSGGASKGCVVCVCPGGAERWFRP